MRVGFQWGPRCVAGVLVLLLHASLAIIFLRKQHVGVLSETPLVEVRLRPEAKMAELKESPWVSPTIRPLSVPTTSMSMPEIEVAQPSSAPIAASIATTAGSDSNAHADDSVPIISEVEYLREPLLHYPGASRRLREQGTVLLRVLIDEAGRASRIDVYRSSGFTRLDEAACRAVREAQFKPYVANGRGQAAVVLVPIEFSLRV